MFCGNCGARLENNEPMSIRTPPVITRSKVSTGLDLKMSITGVMMLIATFLPMIKVDLGKIGELARDYLGDYMPYVDSFKFNVYKVASFTTDDYFGFGIPGWAKALVVFAMIFMIATIIVSVAAGVFRKKSLMLASGVMCCVCAAVCIAIMIYEAYMIGQLNKEIAEYFGEFSAVLGKSAKIGNVNGFGIYLFLICSGLQAYFAFSGARKAA